MSMKRTCPISNSTSEECSDGMRSLSIFKTRDLTSYFESTVGPFGRDSFQPLPHDSQECSPCRAGCHRSGKMPKLRLSVITLRRFSSGKKLPRSIIAEQRLFGEDSRSANRLPVDRKSD